MLYAIYACGAAGLNALFTSTWFIVVSCSIVPILIVYYILIREKIIESYKHEKPYFVTDEEQKKEEYKRINSNGLEKPDFKLDEKKDEKDKNNQ